MCLIIAATPNHMPILVGFGWMENSPKYMKYNLSVTFCSVPFFMHMSIVYCKSPSMYLHNRWLKTRGISQGCAFGFASKKFYFHPTSPQIPKILHYESSFSRKTHIILGRSATEICT